MIGLYHHPRLPLHVSHNAYRQDTAAAESAIALGLKPGAIKTHIHIEPDKVHLRALGGDTFYRRLKLQGLNQRDGPGFYAETDLRPVRKLADTWPHPKIAVRIKRGHSGQFRVQQRLKLIDGNRDQRQKQRPNCQP